VSRLWSRFGLRALSVALLIVAVLGGLHLGRHREAQQQAIEVDTAARAEAADLRTIKEYAALRLAATARQREAEREAGERAKQEARLAAERVKRAERAVASRREAARQQPPKPTVPYPGPIPSSCASYSGNRKIGCALLLDAGFGLKEMPCLDKLWMKESGWNHRARNPSSGAFGIPQALPGGKMASAGADWENNPATQIRWGLGYIKGRYGAPCGAWAHSQRVGWY